MFKVADVAAACVLLGGCTLLPGDASLVRSGPPYYLTTSATEASRTSNYSGRITNVIKEIGAAAGFGENEPQTADEWRQFGTMAFTRSDEECLAYTRALDRVALAQQQAAQQTNLVGTAAVAAMGIVSTAAQAISLTGGAFGLLEASISNYAGGFLFELPPGSIYSLVKRLRAAYEAELDRRGDVPWANRAAAFRTVQGYIALCVPVVIRDNIANSIQVARPVVEEVSRNTPIRTAAPPVIGIEGAAGAGTASGGVPAAAAQGPRTPATAIRPLSPSALAVGGLNAVENSVRISDMRAIQLGLCVPPNGDWRTTRRAVGLWRAARPETGVRNERALSEAELITLMRDTSRPCDTGQFRNVYEKMTVATPTAIERLACRLNAHLERQGLTGATSLEQIRPAIQESEEKFRFPVTGQVTPELMLGLPPCPR